MKLGGQARCHKRALYSDLAGGRGRKGCPPATGGQFFAGFVFWLLVSTKGRRFSTFFFARVFFVFICVCERGRETKPGILVLLFCGRYYSPAQSHEDTYPAFKKRTVTNSTIVIYCVLVTIFAVWLGGGERRGLNRTDKFGGWMHAWMYTDRRKAEINAYQVGYWVAS